MSNTLQTIFIIILTGMAIGYLVRKFIWNPKKKSTAKSCGKDDCGCH